jgi:hypothetical protein
VVCGDGELAPADLLGVLPGGEVDWPRDAKGRTPMTGWRLRARRKPVVAG